MTAPMLERPLPADLVVDTSAFAAILLDEDDGTRCSASLHRAVGPLASTAALMELLMVIEGRRGAMGVAEAKALLRETGTVTVPIDDRVAAEAHTAWQRFGKGRHRAGLNFGDCFSYALAKHWDLPLLCVGDDFTHTDLTLA